MGAHVKAQPQGSVRQQTGNGMGLLNSKATPRNTSNKATRLNPLQTVPTTMGGGVLIKTTTCNHRYGYMIHIIHKDVTIFRELLH